MKTCKWCGCRRRADLVDSNGICSACQPVILRKFADVMDGQFLPEELAVIDEALDGRYMADVIKEVLKDAG